MRAKITFQALVGRDFINVEFKKNKPQPVADASSYWVRGRWDGKRGRKNLGKDFGTAAQKFRNMQLVRELASKDLPVPDYLMEAKPEEKKDEPVQSIRSKADEYVEEIRKDAEYAASTYTSYRQSLENYFIPFCSDPPADCPPFTFPNLNREVWLAYKKRLFMGESKKNKGAKLSPSSVHKEFALATRFLTWCGFDPKDMKPPLLNEDWPAFFRRIPERFTDEELGALCDASDDTERLMWECFFTTGMRDQEMAHAVYGDIDFKTGYWFVKKKPQFNWQPKFGKERDFPVHDWILQKLKARMTAGAGRKKSDLIFYNRDGNPTRRIWATLQKCATRARLDCERIDVHKFRATAITLWLESGREVHEVMEYVGHADADTILHYKAKVDRRKPETRAKATAAFDKFAPKQLQVAAD